MRIVGGRHKGRPLAAPAGRNTRPTSDRAREAMFNVLEHGVPGHGLADAHVIDVFAGTGALGLEALSRGARHATFVETNRGALKTLAANIETLGEQARATVLSIKATNLPPSQSGPASYVFLDAPYEKGLSAPALETLKDTGWLAPGAVILVEIAARETLPLPEGFQMEKEKNYGAARVVFLTYAP